jgi:uncharacterized protein YbgA (DUF1722 family)/uncharacterized protein YbbK (DUF523 family)
VEAPQDDPRPGSWRAWHDEAFAIRIGVSSCLLGEEVRFDGGHKRDGFVADVLGRWVEWTAVCPEVEVGMGIPRPAIRIVESPAGQRLIAPSTGEDFTERMRAFSATRTRELQELGLDGYVLKKSSPSCGMERVSVYRGEQRMSRGGVGLYAETLMGRWPHLPVEEDGRLNDPVLRENFIERIFCRNRWRTLVRRGVSRGRLLAFHTAHKMLLRAHNEAGYVRLGRLVASLGRTPDAEVLALYEDGLQATLRTKTTVKKNTNVLQHALGHFKLHLQPAEKREVLSAIEDYRLGLLPLIVPLTLLRFNIRKYEVAYLLGQLYFDPHPKELMLRNHC